MQYLMPLQPKQTARLIEQAVRCRAAIELEPRNRVGNEPLRGVLTGREDHLLALELRDGAGGVLLDLVGACAEARFAMQDQLYLFSTSVLDVVDEQNPPRLLLTEPDLINAINRRRFERTNGVISSQVRLYPEDGAPPHVGLLGSVSIGGLSCELPGTQLDERLYVGDPARVEFELAGLESEFKLPVVICTKSFNRDKTVLSVGLEFQTPPPGSPAEREIERLVAALYEMSAQHLDLEGD